jgi:mono/diheme cytochrome c family protein
MRNFVFGFFAAIIVLVAGGISLALSGNVPARADVPPSALEKNLAEGSLRRSIGRDSAGLTSPLKPTDADLIAGVKLYGANCAVCHGAENGKPSLLAQGFYIESPMLATKDGSVVDDPERVTYFKVTHGIRFSAMPAFSKTLDETQRWQIAAFVKRMDKLSAPVEAAWKALPSAASAATSVSDVQRSSP